MLKNLTIRIVEPDDAQAVTKPLIRSLTQLSIQTFRDTFATEDNEVDIELYLKAAFSMQQMKTELMDSKNTFLLAYVGGSKNLVGYAKLRLGQEEPCVAASNSIEIERLYVDKQAIGMGVGSKLMQACLDRAIAQSRDVVWLGVWEYNQRAIRFYEKWKFVTVGSHLFRLGNEEQTDLIMQRPASCSST